MKKKNNIKTGKYLKIWNRVVFSVLTAVIFSMLPSKLYNQAQFFSILFKLQDVLMKTSSNGALEPSTGLIIHCHGGGFVAQSSASHEVGFYTFNNTFWNCPC